MDLDSLITARLRKEFEEESALHEPSGKLSAGQLGKPLLEQVLKVIGVPSKPYDDYVLRLFARGKQVEDWALDTLGIADKQVETEYENTVGVIDGITDKGTPVEIKSTKNSALKWIKQSGAKEDHELQLTLYLLAEKKEEGKLIYISAEDFQTYVFTVPVSKRAEQVDAVIKEVYGQIKKGVLPEFEPRQEWHSKPAYAEKYTNYPEWLSLTPELSMEKLKRQFPDSYAKLKKGQDNAVL